MKKAIILFSTFILTYSGFAQKQKAFSILPITKGVGFKSNLTKNNFWDYRLSYNIGVSPAGAVYNFSPEVCWKHRTVNKETVKFYWGIGGLVEYVVPSIIIPVGFEIFPFEQIKAVGFSFEAAPQISLAGFYGVKGRFDFVVSYYFKKKSKE